MGKPVVFMFSGQGSQYYQMGNELYLQNPVFREWMNRLDRIALSMLGQSVVNQLYGQEKRKSDIFDRTIHTHPAIFMVQYALAQILLESGIRPDLVFGVSLGEFVSAAVAGVMEAEKLLELVIKQAVLLEGCCPDGSMLAIIDDCAVYGEIPVIYENSELASVNYPGHFVVSGEKGKIKKIESFLREKGIIHQELPVSYGFHSSLIDPAAARYANFLRHYHCTDAKVPIVSGLYGNIINQLPEQYFWDIARMPMQLPKAVRELEDMRDCLYLDLGQGTLTNFIRRNLTGDSHSEVYPIITPFGSELRCLAKVKSLF
ncbi:MAG: acyltransferase [Peptococcaceae bacterium BICA1-7]|nr:MAG: acyltransferase [Peptococcaceae bacterium BICA1-7]HBV96376.1 acyltransferase [Desulfotomaculum sp.]